MSRHPLLRPLLLGMLGGSVLVIGCTPTPGTTDTLMITPATQTESIKATVSSLKDTVKSLSKITRDLTTATPLTSTPTAAYRLTSLYGVLGSQVSGGYTMHWDDATSQLNRISGSNLSANFTFDGKGASRRTAAVTVSQSPDGTTGSAEIAIDASRWSDVSESTAAPQFWYNQSPDPTQLNALSGKIDLVPQGKEELRIALSGGVDQFQTIALINPHQPIPTHLYASGYVPKLAFDQSFDLKQAGSSQLALTWAGTMNVQTDTQGKQDWQLAVAGTLDSTSVTKSKIDFTFENTTQKFKLVGTMLPKQNGGTLVTGKFTAIEGGQELATLSFDSATSAAPVIMYADGTADYLTLD